MSRFCLYQDNEGLYTEKELLAIAEKHLAHNYAPPDKIFISGGGIFVYDCDGRSYHDLNACYSALPLGHKESGNLDTFPRAFHEPDRILFAKELADFCGMDMVLPMNTGAEAVETAIKLARKWGYVGKKILKDCAEIIVCKNNFHGRTTTIVGFSSNPQYKNFYSPYAPNAFIEVDFGDSEKLGKKITPYTVAVLIEPVQGEGGIIFPPDGYLYEVKEICREHNVLFMLDEVQTGFGRTGTRFAFDHEGAKPDILILAKALGGGEDDISAVVSSEEIMSLFQPGDHGSTFGGNPKACRSARRFLKLFKELNLAENSKIQGAYFLEKLKEFADSKTSIKEVRGRGLFIGIEFNEKFDAKRASQALLKAGLLTVIAKKHILRLSPPLNITKKDIDAIMEKFREADIP
ncbi:MAG: aspartate aminotransferase family protein [Patescibacteria group bacterium]